MPSPRTGDTKAARKARHRGRPGAGSRNAKPSRSIKKLRKIAPTREALSVDRPWFDAKFRELETSQRALADALGRNASAVTVLLKGERSLRTDELPVLARFFGASE